MGALRVILLLLCTICWWPDMAFSRDKQQYFIPLPININVVDELTLSRALVGIGSKKAAAIVAYRQINGPFASLEDLLGVKGIGKATLRKNRDRIRFQ